MDSTRKGGGVGKGRVDAEDGNILLSCSILLATVSSQDMDRRNATHLHPVAI